MTASNRVLNRLILLLAGIVALAGAAWLAWPTLTGAPLDLALGIDVRMPDDQPLTLGIAVAAAIVLIVFAGCWIFTRGRGRTRFAVGTAGVRVDVSAVESLLRTRLSAAPDVASVGLSAFRLRGTRMLLLTVQARHHPDLAAMHAELLRAVRAVDADVGTELPLVVHITTGLRTALGGTRVTR